MAYYEEITDVYRVYSFKLFKYLFDLKFDLIGTKEAEETKKTVFMFKDSAALREAVRRYSEKYPKGKYLDSKQGNDV